MKRRECCKKCPPAFPPTFPLPDVPSTTTTTFTNPSNITINDSDNPPTVANPYPSSMNVAGLTGTITQVTVTLHNISHTFPQDIDILLVGPGGQNVILMSDAGDDNSIVDVTLTFDDFAPALLPAIGQIVSGTYKPTEYEGGDIFPLPAPGGPYGTALSVFNGTNPNGIWNFFVVDDLGVGSGNITGGWDLTITTIS